MDAPFHTRIVSAVVASSTDSMASVFLQDLDDFIAPGQACINPLFTTPDEAPAAASKGDAPMQLVLEDDGGPPDLMQVRTEGMPHFNDCQRQESGTSARGSPVIHIASNMCTRSDRKSCSMCRQGPLACRVWKATTSMLKYVYEATAPSDILTYFTIPSTIPGIIQHQVHHLCSAGRNETLLYVSRESAGVQAVCVLAGTL